MPVTAGRIVAVLTPFFAAGSAVGLGWLGKHFPGLPPLDPTQILALEVAGATAALAPALKWLHGWSLWERGVVGVTPIVAKVESVVDTAQVIDPKLVGQVETAAAVEAEKALKAVGAPAIAWPDLQKVADQAMDAAAVPVTPVAVIAPAAPANTPAA